MTVDDNRGTGRVPSSSCAASGLAFLLEELLEAASNARPPHAHALSRRLAAATGHPRGSPRGSWVRRNSRASPRSARVVSNRVTVSAACRRAAPSRPCEISGRPQQPSRRQLHVISRGLEQLQSRPCRSPVIVVGERVVEEYDGAARRPAARGRSRTARVSTRERRRCPGRRHSPAIDAEQPLVQPAHRRAPRHGVRERREPAAPAPRGRGCVRAGAPAADVPCRRQ